jgi:hypothetical protein
LQLKEKMGMTDTRREVGRMSFADTAGVEFSDMAMGAALGEEEGISRGAASPPTHRSPSSPSFALRAGRDSGRLGIAGSGHVRIERKDQSKLVKRQHRSQQHQHHSSSGLGGTGGISSSLAFTSHVGLELANPAAAAERAQKAVARDGYFSSTGTFTQIRKGM